MLESSLSSQIKRTGNILKKGASDQIIEYNRRFESIKDLYDSFLVDLFVSDFSCEEAYETAKRFFGSGKVEFAAVDGTEYTRPLFDMVIFFGGSYAARGVIEFRKDKTPKVEYATRLHAYMEGMCNIKYRKKSDVLHTHHSLYKPSHLRNCFKNQLTPKLPCFNILGQFLKIHVKQLLNVVLGDSTLHQRQNIFNLL